MKASCFYLLFVVLSPGVAFAQAEALTFKNTGEDAITMEFHRRGEKEEPQIPLPLKPGEERTMKPQEDTFYGLVITDHNGNTHRIGYRRMRGLAVKHPGAVIEIRPRVKVVEAEKEVKERHITTFDIVLTKEGADDLPLEFRKFIKPPKSEP